MNWLSRGALVGLLLAAGCGGGNGGMSGNAPSSIGSSGGGPPPPGQEAGTPGVRGGGGGPFGGGSDPDAGRGGPADDAGTGTGGAGGTDAGRDLASDRPRDTLTPVDAVSMADTAPAPDLGGGPDPCNNNTCEGLENDFRAALSRARSCNPTLKLQCQMTSSTGLRCPGCKVWVNSTVELNAIRMKWNDAGCGSCPKMCPAIACRNITTGTCYSKMLAFQLNAEQPIIPPPATTGTCVDQSDPVPF